MSDDPMSSFEAPSANVTLRAGADGATATVPSHVLAQLARVFADALTLPSEQPAEVPLPGTTREDLDLLLWLMPPASSLPPDVLSAHYASRLSPDNIARVCELAREYDMPAPLAAADEWLAVHASELGPPAPWVNDLAPAHVQRATAFLKWMQLAHELQLTRFLQQGLALWQAYPFKAAVLKACADDARRMDGALLFRMMAAGCGLGVNA